MKPPLLEGRWREAPEGCFRRLTVGAVRSAVTAAATLNFFLCAQQHWFSIGLAVKFLRASDLHSAAETSISGFSNRKLMFHAPFSGVTGEWYAVGQIRLLNAVEIFLTATI